jgi:acyl carrier protein
MSAFDTIREMIDGQFQLDRARITPEATLEPLNIDALATVEFMFLVEEKYQVEATAEHVELRTVQDLVGETGRLAAGKHGSQAAKKDAA